MVLLRRERSGRGSGGAVWAVGDGGMWGECVRMRPHVAARRRGAEVEGKSQRSVAGHRGGSLGCRSREHVGGRVRMRPHVAAGRLEAEVEEKSQRGVAGHRGVSDGWNGLAATGAQREGIGGQSGPSEPGGGCAVGMSRRMAGLRHAGRRQGAAGLGQDGRSRRAWDCREGHARCGRRDLRRGGCGVWRLPCKGRVGAEVSPLAYAWREGSGGVRGCAGRAEHRVKLGGGASMRVRRGEG